MSFPRLVALLLASLCSWASAAEPEELVRLQTWGAPWTDRFDVTLLSDGALKASLNGQEKSEKATIALSTAEAKALHDLAKRAVVDPKTANCNKVVDGSSGKLMVKVGAEQKSQECLNTSKWPPIGTTAEELVKTINAKLPKTIQVY